MQQDALEMLPKPADPSSCVWTYVHRDCQYLPAANTPAIPLSGVHTAGVAGSNPAAPTKNSPQRSRCWRDHFRSLLGGWGPFGPNLDPARAKSRPRRADLRLQVAVKSGRRAHVAVPQQALNAVRVDAGTEKQRCGCVALMPTSA